MSHLKVLKLDHNPLEWPTKDVTTFAGSTSGQPMSKQDEADEMQRWLPALMRWMRENRDREVEREREREREKRRRPSLAIARCVPPSSLSVARHKLTLLLARAQ